MFFIIFLEKIILDTLEGHTLPLLTFAKWKKVKWYGHVVRHDGLPKIVLQGTVESKEDGVGKPNKLAWQDERVNSASFRCVEREDQSGQVGEIRAANTISSERFTYN